MGYSRRLMAFAALLCFASFAHLAYADGPYHGRVIDKETKQPIDGAAIVAAWYEHGPNRSLELYEIEEARTDNQGNFFIPAIPLRPEVMRDPAVYIYRPGYAMYHGLTVLVDGFVAQLPPTRTHEQRLNSLDHATRLTDCPKVAWGKVAHDPECIPKEKVPNWITLVSVEQKTLGVKPEAAQPKRPSNPTNKIIK